GFTWLAGSGGSAATSFNVAMFNGVTVAPVDTLSTTGPGTSAVWGATSGAFTARVTAVNPCGSSGASNAVAFSIFSRTRRDASRGRHVTHRASLEARVAPRRHYIHRFTNSERRSEDLPYELLKTCPTNCGLRIAATQRKRRADSGRAERDADGQRAWHDDAA